MRCRRLQTWKFFENTRHIIGEFSEHPSNNQRPCSPGRVYAFYFQLFGDLAVSTRNSHDRRSVRRIRGDGQGSRRTSTVLWEKDKVQGMLAYCSPNEIHPPKSLTFLLEEIRDRILFSQASNCAHGVLNESFRVCSPSEETLRFQGPVQQVLSWNPSVSFGEGCSNCLMARIDGRLEGISANPRSNLTRRRTPEGPMEKRSGKDVLASFIIAFIFSPKDARPAKTIQVSLVPSSQHVIKIFFVHGPRRWLQI